MPRKRTASKKKRAAAAKQLARAIELHQQGNIQAAEQLYQTIISRQPNHPDALHLLGLIAQTKGKYEKAQQLIEQAIRQDARQPIFYNNLGNVLLDSGRAKEAIKAFTKARSIAPSLDEALYNLANAYQKNGQIEDAVASYFKYVEKHPDHAEAHYNLGKAYKSMGSFPKARESLQRALSLQPRFFDALFELAVVCELENDVEAAVTHYQHAHTIEPEDLESLNSLGNVYQVQGKFNEAIKCYRSALHQDPLHTGALTNLFNLLRNRGFDGPAVEMLETVIKAHPDFQLSYVLLGSYYLEKFKLDDAEEILQQAIRLDSKNATANNLLGLVYSEKGQLSEARWMFRQAIKHEQQPSGPLNNLGRDLVTQGRYQAGIACFKMLLKLFPRSPAVRSNYIFFNHYDDKVPREDLFNLSQTWWLLHGDPLTRPTHYVNNCSTNRRLRIGYVSPDFRRHSVSYFFLPLLESHDRSEFEIICYSQVHRPDEVTERIARSADGWCAATGLNDGLLVDQIQKDGIDILVDLAGHTARNRLPVFARRPAPVQITWLGYPNTTGLPVIDYRLTDAVADPEPAADKWYSEKLIRVPSGFLCFLPPQNAPDIDPLWDLSNQPVAFGSFNNLAKTNKKVISLWSSILRAVPDAILILKSRPLADNSTRKRYLKLFGKQGIAAERIQMLPATRSIGEHLGMYNRVAIGLDPLPYNGTTTTCEALFMGVPVVTMAGDRHSARVGASILTRIGLTDLITHSEEEYISKAVELANNWAYISRLKTTLRQILLQSDLCNARQFAAQIEQIYRSVWAQWCNSPKERHDGPVDA